ncbi:M10 family metallopeptidase C-terminal domain-containing protein [Microvirga alba]|uniref:Calcium-binding protein n=1 Tax=Microvirga alba TaxID=2791025 RepID=A0A931BTC3_9HYPH|nr:calcium-binding protein [Microvirga alba]MBF9233440.1 calcium-binding protein [Microvirga alba]
MPTFNAATGTYVYLPGEESEFRMEFADPDSWYHPRPRYENYKVLGNDRNNVIEGNHGRNVINGGAGNDLLNGGAGNDTLIGGAGDDTFLFDTRLNSKTNVDVIKDFNVRHDTIRLAHLIFKGTPKTAFDHLDAKAFWTGAAAHDQDDRIIYNPANGALSYDPDGDGPAKAIKFAILSKHLKLTADQFEIF